MTYFTKNNLKVSEQRVEETKTGKKFFEFHFCDNINEPSNEDSFDPFISGTLDNNLSFNSSYTLSLFSKEDLQQDIDTTNSIVELCVITRILRGCKQISIDLKSCGLRGNTYFEAYLDTIPESDDLLSLKAGDTIVLAIEPN